MPTIKLTNRQRNTLLETAYGKLEVFENSSNKYDKLYAQQWRRIIKRLEGSAMISGLSP